MFWRLSSRLSTPTVDEILAREVFTLEELLDEVEDLVHECAKTLSPSSPRLVSFLKEREQVLRMVHYVVELPFDDADDKRRFKYPLVSCEVLSSDIDDVLNTTVTDGEIMDLLFSFTDPKHSHPHLLAGYFSRVVGSLLLQKPTEVMAYLQTHPHAVTQLVDLVGMPSILEVVLKVVGVDEQMVEHADKLQWLADTQLMDHLLAQLSQQKPSEVQANAVQVLSAIAWTAPSRLAQCLASKRHVNTLLDHALCKRLEEGEQGTEQGEQQVLQQSQERKQDQHQQQQQQQQQQQPEQSNQDGRQQQQEEEPQQQQQQQQQQEQQQKEQQQMFQLQRQAVAAATMARPLSVCVSLVEQHRRLGGSGSGSGRSNFQQSSSSREESGGGASDMGATAESAEGDGNGGGGDVERGKQAGEVSGVGEEGEEADKHERRGAGGQPMEEAMLTMVDRLGDLVAVLQAVLLNDTDSKDDGGNSSCSGDGLPTSYGRQLQPPLGSGRVKVVELLGTLLLAEQQSVAPQLIRLDALRTCLDLLLRYPFNNALHHQVERLVAAALDSGDASLLRHVFVDCCLLQRILDAFGRELPLRPSAAGGGAAQAQAAAAAAEVVAAVATSAGEDQAQSSAAAATAAGAGRQQARVGYLGHLTRIANRVVQLASANADVASAYVAPCKHWGEWQRTALKQRNHMEDLRQWTCGRPTALDDFRASSEEEEDDDDDDDGGEVELLLRDGDDFDISSFSLSPASLGLSGTAVGEEEAAAATPLIAGVGGSGGDGAAGLHAAGSRGALGSQGLTEEEAEASGAAAPATFGAPDGASATNGNIEASINDASAGSSGDVGGSSNSLEVVTVGQKMAQLLLLGSGNGAGAAAAAEVPSDDTGTDKISAMPVGPTTPGEAGWAAWIASQDALQGRPLAGAATIQTPPELAPGAAVDQTEAAEVDDSADSVLPLSSQSQAPAPSVQETLPAGANRLTSALLVETREGDAARSVGNVAEGDVAPTASIGSGDLGREGTSAAEAVTASSSPADGELTRSSDSELSSGSRDSLCPMQVQSPPLTSGVAS